MKYILFLIAILSFGGILYAIHLGDQRYGCFDVIEYTTKGIRTGKHNDGYAEEQLAIVVIDGRKRSFNVALDTVLNNDKSICVTVQSVGKGHYVIIMWLFAVVAISLIAGIFVSIYKH